ncbi:MAG: MarR family transcriptional regulator [Chloroflexi bacterium]|nr:MarR family transcriptional regulator [Chloroflexota bacterium]
MVEEAVAAPPLTPLYAAMAEFFRASELMEPLRLRIWDLEGLTVTQLRLLMFVSQCEGLSNAELAQRMYVTRPSVSALLERLERGGFLRREISPNDRRGICIWLEERGRNVCNAMATECADYVSGLMESLSERDLCELANSLAKMVKAGRERRERDLLEERQRSPEDL